MQKHGNDSGDRKLGGRFCEWLAIPDQNTDAYGTSSKHLWHATSLESTPSDPLVIVTSKSEPRAAYFDSCLLKFFEPRPRSNSEAILRPHHYKYKPQNASSVR